MKNLIYYPTFEPNDLTWLKYALLYLEDFSPIIPVRGNSELSDVFLKIRDSTELVKAVEPTWQQGEAATARAIEQIESIKTYPHRYAFLFDEPEINNVWANPLLWNEKLYREKFSELFENYCVQSRLGARVKEGLLLSRQLAGFYMTFLVEQIALDKQGSPITDLPELDGVSTFLRTKDLEVENRWAARKAAISLYLPKDMDKINIDDFISFRNNAGVTELRTSFNRTLDAFYTSVEENYDPITYAETLRTLNKSLVKEIGTFFGGSAAFTINCFLAAAHPVHSIEVIAKLLEGGVAITGLSGVRKEWKLGTDRRNARKFLSRVRQLA